MPPRPVRGRLGLRLDPKGLEGISPELVEKVAQRAKTVRLNGVHASCAEGPVGDQTGVLQDAKLLGNRRTADGKRSRQFADGLRPVAKPQEDGAAGAIAQGVELRLMVSNH